MQLTEIGVEQQGAQEQAQQGPQGQGPAAAAAGAAAGEELHWEVDTGMGAAEGKWKVEGVRGEKGAAA